MPINPVHFAHSICDEFLRYIFSAFPITDPGLATQARQQLRGKTSLDIPLVQGPFVSLSEAFAKGESVQAMANRGLLHPIMPGLIGYPSMWLHQQQVFEAVKAGQHVLVATGTGSGKTESFLYPIIDDLLRQRDQDTYEGLTAILVYPMNALANDQLDRLRDMLGGTGITFALWVGTTPATEAEVSMERFPGTGRVAYLAARQQRRDEAQAEDRAVRLLAPPEECCSEDDICQRKPRILLTNFRQLALIEKRDGCHVWKPEDFPKNDPRHGWTWDDCWNDAVALLGSVEAVSAYISQPAQDASDLVRSNDPLDKLFRLESGEGRTREGRLFR